MSNTHQQILGNLIKQKDRSHDKPKSVHGNHNLPKINQEKYDHDHCLKEAQKEDSSKKDVPADEKQADSNKNQYVGQKKKILKTIQSKTIIKTTHGQNVPVLVQKNYRQKVDPIYKQLPKTITNRMRSNVRYEGRAPRASSSIEEEEGEFGTESDRKCWDKLMGMGREYY